MPIRLTYDTTPALLFQYNLARSRRHAGQVRRHDDSAHCVTYPLVVNISPRMVEISGGFKTSYQILCGPGSVVGIATGYGLDGPGIESRWGGDIFRTCSDRPCGPPSLLYNGYRVFPGVKSGRSVTLTHHSLLVLWSWKGRAIPLLHLRAVRPVQRLSACTRVHFFFITRFCKQDWGSEYKTCGACWGAHRFAWLEKLWSFKKRTNF